MKEQGDGMQHKKIKPINKFGTFFFIIFTIALIEFIAELITMSCVLPFIGVCAVDITNSLVNGIFLITFTTPLIAYIVIRPYVLRNLDLIEKLNNITKHDDLSGLYNRRALMEKLSDIQIEIKSNNPSLKFLFFLIDLDNFKNINDTMGHHIGDQLLIEIAKRLQSIFSTDDNSIYRIGGDEFVALQIFPHQDPIAIGNDITNCISKPFTIYGHKIQTNACVGVTIIEGVQDNDSYFLRNADIALYKAKKSIPKQRVLMFEKTS